MEQTRVLTAVGRRVSPARLALNPALRLFRDSVRLKANTSASFNWEEGFFAGETSPVDESIFVVRASFAEEVILEEEESLVGEVFLEEKESLAGEVSLEEKGSLAEEEFLVGEAPLEEKVFSAGEEFLMGEASLEEEESLAEVVPFTEVDVISGGWAASGGALGQQFCRVAITHLTI